MMSSGGSLFLGITEVPKELSIGRLGSVALGTDSLMGRISSMTVGTSPVTRAIRRGMSQLVRNEFNIFHQIAEGVGHPGTEVAGERAADENSQTADKSVVCSEHGNQSVDDAKNDAADGNEFGQSLQFSADVIKHEKYSSFFWGVNVRHFCGINKF